MDMRETSNRTGFTLIELLVVITIIIVLGGLLMAGVQVVLAHARKQKVVAHLNLVKQGIEVYRDEIERLPSENAPGINALAFQLCHPGAQIYASLAERQMTEAHFGIGLDVLREQVNPELYGNPSENDFVSVDVLTPPAVGPLLDGLAAPYSQVGYPLIYDTGSSSTDPNRYTLHDRGGFQLVSRGADGLYQWNESDPTVNPLDPTAEANLDNIRPSRER